MKAFGVENLPGNKQNAEVIDAIMALKIGLLNWDLPQVAFAQRWPIRDTKHLKILWSAGFLTLCPLFSGFLLLL